MEGNRAGWSYDALTRLPLLLRKQQEGLGAGGCSREERVSPNLSESRAVCLRGAGEDGVRSVTPSSYRDLPPVSLQCTWKTHRGRNVSTCKQRLRMRKTGSLKEARLVRSGRGRPGKLNREGPCEALTSGRHGRQRWRPVNHETTHEQEIGWQSSRAPLCAAEDGPFSQKGKGNQGRQACASVSWAVP